MEKFKKIGFILNPIAGMGGKVALKGTDGEQVLSTAVALGARPEAHLKAEKALSKLLLYKESFRVYTVAGAMGEGLCAKLGLNYTVVYTPSEETSAKDTLAAAEALLKQKIELLVFAGGDGTARNICQAVGEQVPSLGIPAGVKIQSAVFGLTPEKAGNIVVSFVRDISMTMEERDVVDLDEAAYRTGKVKAKLYGSLLVPGQKKLLQSMKQSGFSSAQDQLRGVAVYLEEHMDKDVYYALGSGSTAKCLSRYLNVDYELLGIDIMQNKKLIAKDVTEEELWHYAERRMLKIIVSPIGGQGFIFGRGNHQFSARILERVGKNNITVISSQDKLLSISKHTMYVDCGDEKINRLLRGYYNVLCGYGYYQSFKCD